MESSRDHIFMGLVLDKILGVDFHPGWNYLFLFLKQSLTFATEKVIWEK